MRIASGTLGMARNVGTAATIFTATGLGPAQEITAAILCGIAVVATLCIPGRPAATEPVGAPVYIARDSPLVSTSEG